MIPPKLYKKIVELVPILCVDVILVHDRKYILVKRKTEPLKGEWWVVGGRALKGEKSIAAAKRKVKQEVGLKVENLELDGIYEDSYKKSAWGVPTSSVSIVYRGDVVKLKPKLDETISKIRLSETLPRRFLKHLKYV